MSQRIHLDATPGLFHQVLHCHQGDVGRQFEIAVVTRDGYEIPSGATFKIQATKPSGLGFTVTGTAANNIISFTSTEDMTSEAGEIPTQLEIKSGNDVIYTSNFLLVCEKNTHPSSVTDGSPEEIISEITLLVERAESAASTAGADAAAAAQARVDEMMDYLPSEVADLKSELTDETNARILLAGRMTTAEGDIDTLETHKVAQPLDEYNQPTDGTDGQLLRTKGDGTTEWADVGLPTDAQTAQAVSDWLDDHPDATTTVQDGSLTEAKFTDALKLKAIKDYITPQMFGAVGDGVTDDTLAITRCIAESNGKPIFFPNGIYAISNEITISGSGYTLFGTGKANSILKFTNTSLIPYAIGKTESTNYANINIFGLALECNENVERGIKMLNSAYSKISDIRITDAPFGIDISGWCNSIEDAQLINCASAPIRCYDAPILNLKNVQSNRGSMELYRVNGSINGCAMDNGNPSYSIIDSNVSMDGCDCETYNKAFAITGSRVSINGGRFEHHKSEDAPAPTGCLDCTSGSDVILNVPYIYYDDYGTGITTQLWITANDAKIHGFYDSNVENPWYVANGGIIECNQKCMSDDILVKNIEIVDASNTRTPVSIEIPAKYRQPRNIEVNLVGYYYDSNFEVIGTALVSYGNVISNNIAVHKASGESVTVTVGINSGSEKVTLTVTSSEPLTKMYGTVRY